MLAEQAAVYTQVNERCREQHNATKNERWQKKMDFLIED